MREVVIVLLVVVLAIMVVGAVNQDQHVDFDYVVGTWENVSVLELSAVAAGIVFVMGLGSAAIVRSGLIGGRRKLERELQETYVRLRAAEAAGAPPQLPPPGPAPGTPMPSAQPAIPAGEAPMAAESVSPAQAGSAHPAVADMHLVAQEAPSITERTEFPMAPSEAPQPPAQIPPAAEAFSSARPGSGTAAAESVIADIPAADEQTVIPSPPVVEEQTVIQTPVIEEQTMIHAPPAADEQTMVQPSPLAGEQTEVQPRPGADEQTVVQSPPGADEASERAYSDDEEAPTTDQSPSSS